MSRPFLPAAHAPALLTFSPLARPRRGALRELMAALRLGVFIALACVLIGGAILGGACLLAHALHQLTGVEPGLRPTPP